MSRAIGAITPQHSQHLIIFVKKSVAIPNLHGLMLETQDNNLIACKFYHNCGFKIGSVDTMLYANFENNFEKAVFWYLRF